TTDIKLRLRTDASLDVKTAESIWGEAHVVHLDDDVRPPYEGKLPKEFPPKPPDTVWLAVPEQQVGRNGSCIIQLEIPGKASGDLRSRSVRTISATVLGFTR